MSASPPAAEFAERSTPNGERAAAARPDGGSKVLRLAMVFALYAVPVVVTLRPVADPVMDPDVWWHLRTGQWVAEHRAVPQTDPFTAYGQDKPWVAYSWLYEVGVYGLYAWLGLAGVIAYRVALALAVVAAVHHLIARREPLFLRATLLTGLAVLALAMLFNERPWLCTVLFCTLTLDAVLDLREGRAGPPVWSLPVVYVLWASLHIQFVYGLFLLGLACAAPVLDRLLGQGRPGDTAATAPSRGWWRLVALTAGCALATLANPYHVRVYGVVLEYATQPGPFRFVNELKALEFRELPDWVMLALAGCAAFALGRRQRLSSFEVLLLAAAAFFAFRARRDLWFLVLASVAILSASGPRAAPAAERFPLTGWRLAALAVGLALLIALTARARHLSAANLESKVEGVFPARAADVVAERGYAGPLYNDFNWGGYLIWRLPHLPTAMDGRTNLHGDERILRFGATWSGAAGWQDDPDLCAAGVVIAPADTPLASLLATDPRFRLVYEDPLARVFVKK
jgi:hypothetical protein